MHRWRPKWNSAHSSKHYGDTKKIYIIPFTINADQSYVKPKKMQYMKKEAVVVILIDDVNTFLEFKQNM